MTTTHATLALAVTAQAEAVTPNRLLVGDIIVDPLIPFSGVGVVRKVTTGGMSVFIDLDIATDDGDASDDIHVHTSERLHRAIGTTARRTSSGWYVASTRTRRDSGIEADLLTALDFVFRGV